MRTLIAITLSVVLLVSLSLHASAASVTPPGRITIRLNITGAVTRQVTLSHLIVTKNADFGCQVLGGFTTSILGLTYNHQAWAELDLARPVFGRPAFFLTVDGYSRTTTRYTNMKQISMGLALMGEGYVGVASGTTRPTFAATVLVHHGGRTGRFRATQLVGTVSRRLVNVAGTWSCDTLYTP